MPRLYLHNIYSITKYILASHFHLIDLLYTNIIYMLTPIAWAVLYLLRVSISTYLIFKPSTYYKYLHISMNMVI